MAGHSPPRTHRQRPTASSCSSRYSRPRSQPMPSCTSWVLSDCPSLASFAICSAFGVSPGLRSRSLDRRRVLRHHRPPVPRSRPSARRAPASRTPCTRRPSPRDRCCRHPRSWRPQHRTSGWPRRGPCTRWLSPAVALSVSVDVVSVDVVSVDVSSVDASCPSTPTVSVTAVSAAASLPASLEPPHPDHDERQRQNRAGNADPSHRCTLPLRSSGAVVAALGADPIAPSDGYDATASSTLSGMSKFA